MAIVADDLIRARGGMNGRSALDGNPAAPAEFCARRIICSATRALVAARAVERL